MDSFPVLNKKNIVSGLKCIFCNKSEGVVKCPQEASFLTVQNALARWKNDVTERFEALYRPKQKVQTFSWHRTCFANHVSERKIQKRENELSKIDNVNSSNSTTTSSNRKHPQELRRSSRSQTKKMSHECIVCEKKKKNRQAYIISTKGRAEKFINAARMNINSNNIFTKISMYATVDSFLAAKIRCHQLCYAKHVYAAKNSPVRRPLLMPDPTIIRQVFSRVLEEIDISNQMFDLQFLIDRTNFFLKQSNENCINFNTMKEFLVDEYGEGVLFCESRSNNKSQIVLFTKITISDLVDRLRQVDNISSKIQHVTSELKKEMYESNLNSINSYVCDDGVTDKFLNTFELPTTWNAFLESLLCNKKKLHKQQDKLIKAKSIFMDIWCIVQKMESPKHIALAQTVHHLFRSKHLINILSKLGHSISYHKLTECNNFILQKQSSQQVSNYIMQPSNIVKNDTSLFLHGAIDNNDFLEETLSGKNTTHVTSMVLYQEKSSVPWNDVNVVTKNSVKDVEIDLSSSCLEHFVCTNAKPKFKELFHEMNGLKSKINNYLEWIWILSKLVVDPDDDDSYIIIRDKKIVIPNWSPFNELISTNNQPVSIVGHGSMLPYSPTSDGAVYTALKNFVSVSESYGKEYSILTADMAIYIKSKLIQMQSPNPFPKLIMRVGIWLRILGDYLDGNGVEDIFTDDLELYGESTLQSIFKGLQYNRGIRLHKLLYESIKTIQIFEYIRSCDESILVKFLSTSQYKELRKSINERNSHKAREIIKELNESQELTEFFNSFDNFLKNQCESNQTFLYFNNYCAMVEILLNSIRADRTGDFDLHLSSTVESLPYLFACNHPLYVKGILLYLQDMLNLPNSVKSDLQRGMLSVKRKNGTFNGVGGDLALEQIQNRSSAVSGGWTGISTNETSLQKWIRLHPIKSAIHKSLLAFCNLDDDPFDSDDTSSTNHKEWNESRMRTDDEDVDNIINTLLSKSIFDSSDVNTDLINISNGKCATDEVTTYLLNLKENGEELVNNFVQERFVKKEKSVFDRIPKIVVKNFNYMKNKSKKKNDSKELKDIKEILDIQQTIMLLFQRGFTIESFASHELLDYPKSLADSEGLLKKSAKSDLMNEIENRSNCNYSDNLKLECKKVHVFDGMAIVHLLKLDTCSNFGQFAEKFYNFITSFFGDRNVKSIHVVFDRYDDLGLKYCESLLRSKDLETSEIKIQNADTKITFTGKNYFACVKNKLALVQFLCQTASNYVSLNNEQELFISGGFPQIEKCYKLTSNSIFDVIQLQNNHLEADTRIFTHAHYNFQRGSQIIIHSIDTDVFILGIYYWKYFESQGCDGLFIKIHGPKSRTLACPVAAMYLPTHICTILPALHAFSGCDSTSKIGTKKKVLDIVCKNQKYSDALLTLGTNNYDIEKFKILEKLYLDILGKNGETADDARKRIFNRNCGIGINMSNIPCTSDAFFQHVLRAFAQTFIWIRALSPYHEFIDFTLWGYHKTEHGLLPKYLTKKALPENVIQPCNCNKTCKTKACHCKKNGVSCVAMCGCDLDMCENKI
ncbi:hypothetical protein TKK_0014358 [Trichogramma kaykai]|uniref:Tesmin/TSO1-like CXC domain-containing protein n=1 Tax=Trichogramma kaykai TaxID=54128 RepID=A0ABD2WF40_9HYME